MPRQAKALCYSELMKIAKSILLSTLIGLVVGVVGSILASIIHGQFSVSTQDGTSEAIDSWVYAIFGFMASALIGFLVSMYILLRQK